MELFNTNLFESVDSICRYCTDTSSYVVIQKVLKALFYNDVVIMTSTITHLALKINNAEFENTTFGPVLCC